MTKNEKESGFISHLTELRSRLIHSFIFLFLFFILCYFFSENIYNFLVKPYVAWHSDRPLFSIDSKEVNSLLIFPVSDLAEESNWRNYTVNGVGVPGIKFGKHLVWGATAMMLREFIDTFAK